ncbi:MAG: fasciclin domain-containing protein [Pseudanabaenaceae cyanobacterium]
MYWKALWTGAMVICLGLGAGVVPVMAEPGAKAEKTTAKEAKASGTIVDVAAANQDFSTLVKAVKAAGLAETLSGKGPFTVFAPTNEAFAALPAGTLAKLMQPANRETLKKVLTYHVVAGQVKSSDVKPGEVKTLQGSPATVAIQDGKPTIAGAGITKTDVMASNGVIHVINKVMLPPGLQL